MLWQQFKSVYEWDQNSFSLPLHEKLTLQHFELDAASKMRNRLAEDILDHKMLFLMKVKVINDENFFPFSSYILLDVSV